MEYNTIIFYVWFSPNIMNTVVTLCDPHARTHARTALGICTTHAYHTCVDMLRTNKN
jgi:hypothetical protein